MFKPHPEHRSPTFAPRAFMNILFGIFLFSVLLLVLDLWTQPKPAQAPPANLKD